MRQIKFRAWHDGKMGYWPDWHITFTGQFVKEENGGLTWLVGSEAPPLMQYTGLKDKNGVEIYEGDIVKDPSMSRPQVVFYSIEHAAFKLRFRGEETQYDKRESLFGDYVEVIGNIYEHPELVKEAA